MYRLHVFAPDADSPTEVVAVRDAQDVLQRIPELLERHPHCRRIDVLAGLTRLFSVDCKGDRLKD